ncbi:MAG: hypothetical protein PUP91_05215 [Rhizonema sp. PD37]|nr:hypothetical protein [Rhizonema sp. PD37]
MLKQTPTEFNIEDEDELEASIDGLLDEFALSVGAIATLSNYAVSREGIYDPRA